MTTFKAQPYKLINSIQHYAWGSKGSEAFIPTLMGVAAEKDMPYAELWMGAHPKASSQVVLDGQEVPLNELIQRYPREILGASVADVFNNQLPFLFKVLSADHALSIQAHPNKAQARLLHAQSPELYPDENHKPEIAIALNQFSACIGFRSITEINQILINYPEITSFIGENVQPLSSSDDLRQLFSRLMQRATDNAEALTNTLMCLKERLTAGTAPRTAHEELFLALHKQYGDDIGLFVIFFLNLINLEPGEGVFLHAGVPHAYLKGTIIECMANSDNVVRAGLTPKHKDVTTLIDLLTYEYGPIEILKGDCDQHGCTYQTPAPEYEVNRISLSSEEVVQKTSTSVELLLVIEGIITVTWQQQSMSFERGNVVLIPAALEQYQFYSKTNAKVFRVLVPSD